MSRILDAIVRAELGRNKVINRIAGPIPEMAGIYSATRLAGYNPTIPLMIIVIILYYTVAYYLGIWYEKKGYLKREQEFNNKNNPTLQYIKEVVKKD